MPAPDPNRDAFEKAWERLATAWAGWEVVLQSDASQLEPILRRTALSFASPTFKPPARRFVSVRLRDATPDSCADRAASNLEKLVAERDSPAAMGADEAMWFSTRRSALAKLLSEHSTINMPLSPGPANRLHNARLLFLRTFT